MIVKKEVEIKILLTESELEKAIIQYIKNNADDDTIAEFSEIQRTGFDIKTKYFNGTNEELISRCEASIKQH